MSFDFYTFADPPRALGGLKIQHSVVPHPTYDGRDREAARQTFRALKDIGYAGVVTNLPFENGYLDNDNNWAVLKSMLQAADDEDMRLWLYDEKGYPSGAAGGKTLRENPDWECKGIVCLTARGTDVTIALPHGHTRFIAAYAYEGTGFDDIDYAAARPLPWDDAVRYQGEERFVCAFVQKPCFEMTHAAQNVFAIRRYIDVCDRDAVAAFIRNTYQAYYDHEKAFFGGRFEAIFTDEPSYMAPYIDNGNPTDPEAYASGQGSRWRIPMLDRIDPSIPLYPTLPWTPDVMAEIDPRTLPALFGGSTGAARQARWRYHHAMSRLYGERFFGQIGAWCEAHGIAFSGHILLEDEIKMHPLYEGDFFEKLKHMRVPGIDILNCKPENVWKLMFTPKLVSSIARLNGRTRVMSESSAHFEKSMGIPVSLRERLCSTAMQYAAGITLINSYYAPEELPPEQNLRFGRFLQRLTWLCEGGRPSTCAALYYPIDSLFADTLPSGESIWVRRYAEGYQKTADWFQDAAIELLRLHADYEVLNTDAIIACAIEDGALITPSGARLRAVLLPPMTMVPEALTHKLLQAQKAGVQLIVGDDAHSAHDDAAYHALAIAGTHAPNGMEAAALAARVADPAVCADARWLLATVFEFADHHVALLVNTDGEAREADIALKLHGRAYLLKPETGESEPLDAVPGRLAFQPWETLALWVDKA